MTSYQQSKQYNDSLDLLEGRCIAMDKDRAFRLNAEVAKEGLIDAVLAMGWFYSNGIGVQQDRDLAKQGYRKAARRGEPRAMFSLGQIAFDEADWSGAKVWFQRAADEKHHRSLFWLGKLYWKGRGVPKSTQLAKQFFHRAAAKKVPEAQRAIRMLR